MFGTYFEEKNENVYTLANKLCKCLYVFYVCTHYSRFYEKYIDYSEDVIYFIPAAYFVDFYNLYKIKVFPINTCDFYLVLRAF